MPDCGEHWDDRLMPPLRTNLIDTYLELKAFINKHLPEKFYMEGDQRVDLAVVAGGCFRTLVWTTHFVRAVHGFLPV